jgi:hypothetical protein
MKHLACCLLLALAATGLAAADTSSPNELMTQKAMQAELYGVRISGVEIGTGAGWNECIEPGGRTVYEYGGRRIEGLLTITEAPAACFTYPETGVSCFRVQRAVKGYMFRSTDYGITYHASKVERGVKKCFATDLVG